MFVNIKPSYSNPYNEGKFNIIDKDKVLVDSANELKINPKAYEPILGSDSFMTVNSGVS